MSAAPIPWNYEPPLPSILRQIGQEKHKGNTCYFVFFGLLLEMPWSEVCYADVFILLCSSEFSLPLMNVNVKCINSKL